MVLPSYFVVNKQRPSIMVTPSARHPHDHSVVRKGPLCIGGVLLLAVPLIILLTLDVSHEQRADRLVDGHAWKQTFQGPSFTRKLPGLHQGVVVAAETTTSKCELHQGAIVLEVSNFVEVVVIDQQDNVWVQQIPDSSIEYLPDIYALPPALDATTQQYQWYRPLSAYTGSNSEAPYSVAQRLITQLLGDTIQWTPENGQSLVELDSLGLQQGNGSSTSKDGLHFLGRHRSLSDRGGGFAYMYYFLSTTDTENSQRNYDSSHVYTQLTVAQVEQALLRQQFVDARAVSAMTLALLHHRSTTRKRI